MAGTKGRGADSGEVVFSAGTDTGAEVQGAEGAVRYARGAVTETGGLPSAPLLQEGAGGLLCCVSGGDVTEAGALPRAPWAADSERLVW